MSPFPLRLCPQLWDAKLYVAVLSAAPVATWECLVKEFVGCSHQAGYKDFICSDACCT